MPPAAGQTLRSILQKFDRQILADWMRAQLAATTLRADLMQESELREQSREFLNLMRPALEGGRFESTDSSDWIPVKEFLAGVSRTRAQQGFSSAETATF